MTGEQMTKCWVLDYGEQTVCCTYFGRKHFWVEKLGFTRAHGVGVETEKRVRAAAEKRFWRYLGAA